MSTREKLSTLIDQGRFFLLNEAPEVHGQYEPAAYRGYRPPTLARLVDSYDVLKDFNSVSGIIAAKLEQQGDEVGRRDQALTARKVELQETLAFELTDRNIDNLLQFRETVALGLGNPTPEERRLWLEQLQTKVAVTNGVAVVACRLGGEAVKFSLLTGYQTC